MSWLCPLCQASLEMQANSLRCPQGHQFDMAKEGYVNLLPVQHKHSRDPGDNAAMIQARRAFLDAGHYQPLRDAIAGHLAQNLPDAGPELLDIGCGEGYYTAKFAALTTERSGQCWGLDVSKVAIRAAAKRYPQARFCVASSHRLPFSDASMDAVVRIYAPCNPQELERVVRPGGIVITATPGPRHLVQLKELIYPQVKLHPESQESLAGFEACEPQALSYPMSLTGQEAVALLQMTPFAWRARPETWQKLADTDTFSCEADFVISIWRKI